MKNFTLASLTIYSMMCAVSLDAQATETSQITKDELGELNTQQTLELSAMLETCEAFTQTFQHPFTNEPLERSIAGVVDGKCLYTEQMPNDGKMVCNYSENDRIAAAKYYRKYADEQEFSMKSTTKLSSDGELEEETKIAIGGEEVENILQNLMMNGTCVISGY